MGLMRFLVYPDQFRVDWPEASRAYISGLDGRISPTRIDFEGPVLNCRRAHSDSGKLHIAWPVAGVGRVVLTTASLREREQPYLLALELARGKLSQMREQYAAWQALRMSPPRRYQTMEREAFGLFSRAAGMQDDATAASELSNQSLERACAASDMLVNAYIEQRVAQRRPGGGPLALLGCSLDGSVSDSPVSSEFCETFNAAVLPIEWRLIEPEEGAYDWRAVDELLGCCGDLRLVVRGGPLIDLGPGGLPAWLRPWQDDVLNLQSFIADFIETAIARYQGRIRIWEVSARANSGSDGGIREENRLALAARSLETAHRVDGDSQLFIRVDQPWSEYQARGDHRLSAFQFVDALVRSNIGLTGVNLEIAIGYHPRGSMLRDLLTVSRMIDLWSVLGLQLHVTLAVPSSAGPDPLAEPTVELDPALAQFTPEGQANLLNDLVRLLTAKPSVTGVFLAHFHDAQPHRYAHAGLLGADGVAKPALEVLQRRREQWAE